VTLLEEWEDTGGDIGDLDELATWIGEETEDATLCKKCHSEGSTRAEVLHNVGAVSVSCRCGVDLVHEVRRFLGLPADTPLVAVPFIDNTGPVSQRVELYAETLAKLQRFRPQVFRCGGRLVSVVNGKAEPVSTLLLTRRLGEVTRTIGRRPVAPIDPPAAIVNAIRESADEWKTFPVLDRIVSVPVLLADGRTLTRPGYDDVSCTFYAPSVEGLTVPDTITREDVDAAVELITITLLGDFPFETNADRANAVACMLQAFVRAQIHGPCPMSDFDAPQSRTGKTKLCELVLLPSCGEVTSTGFPKSPGKQEKELLDELRKAPAAVMFDNVTGQIDSEVFERILTAGSGTTSILDVNTSHKVTVNIHQTFCMTTNNGLFGLSMHPRVLPIRIDARCEHPEERTGPTPGTTWRHKNVEAWAHEHRAELITACLTLCTWWEQEGRPVPVIPPHAVMGGFEGWQHTLGGILQSVGIDGFCENLADWRESTPENAERAERLRKLHAKFGDDPFTAAQCVDAKLGGRGQTPKSFGMALSSDRDAPAGGLVLRRVPDPGRRDSTRYVVESR